MLTHDHSIVIMSRGSIVQEPNTDPVLATSRPRKVYVHTLHLHMPISKSQMSRSLVNLLP